MGESLLKYLTNLKCDYIPDVYAFECFLSDDDICVNELLF